MIWSGVSREKKKKQYINKHEKITSVESSEMKTETHGLFCVPDWLKKKKKNLNI